MLALRIRFLRGAILRSPILRGPFATLAVAITASLAPGSLGRAQLDDVLGNLSTDLSAVSGVSCEDGFADVFPCRNVDLLAWVPGGAFGAGLGNDLWGWTDPLTGHEYAIVGHEDAVAFVDLSDAENPVHLGNLPTHTESSIWNDIRTHADHAFIVSEATSHGMQIFDLTQLREVVDPPVTFTATAHYDGFGSAHNIAINEDTGIAYVVGSNTCSGGSHMLDLADPRNPVFAGCVSEDGYTHDTQCVIYTGPDVEHRDKEICFSSNLDTLTIADVTEKAAPRILSRTGYAGSSLAHQGWLTENQDYFLLGDELDEIDFGHNSRTYVWKVTDLDAPTLVGNYTANSPAPDHNLFVRGDHVFEANYTSGLRVLRLGNLEQAELTEVAFFDTIWSVDTLDFVGAWGVYPFFESDVVIVNDILLGLFVLQVDLAAVPRCEDGIDNDSDGLIDAADPDCSLCAQDWPEISITTIAKGQSSEKNATVSHTVTGHIVGGVDAYGEKASRIKLCEGLAVNIDIFDSSSGEVGPAVDPLTPGIGCSLGPGSGEPDANATCTVSALTTTEKYKVESEGGKDTDRVALIPVP